MTVSGRATLRGSLDGLMGAYLPAVLLAISDIWLSPWMCIRNDYVSLYILGAVANVLVPGLVPGLLQPLQPHSPRGSLGSSQGATCSLWHAFP